MNTIDILSIHNTLIRKYQHGSETDVSKQSWNESSVQDEYHKWKDLYDTMKSRQNTSSTIVNEVEHKLRTITDAYKKNQNKFYYYLMRAIPLIDQYYHFKKQQRKIHFVVEKKSITPQPSSNHDMDTIINEYLSLVESYFPEDYLENQWGKIRHKEETIVKSHIRMKCSVCDNDNDSFSIYDNHFVCEKCGFESSTTTHNNVSYKDIDRVNISSKYTYDRRTHFRDCINQFQGKQNATVDQKVYDDLIQQFLLHGLLVEHYDTLPKHVAFKDITKEHILLFLKETGHTKHYEDVVLIFHQMTEKPAPDISHLENDLLRDFDMLTDLYDKKYKNSERKNFINTQYVLYQLLRRHKFPCRKEDFNILKTIDRKYYHDTICADLFMVLGWNFQALF